MSSTQKSSDPLLDIKDLNVEFKTASGWFPAIRNVSLSIERNEIFGLVGESGSGKSVTAMSILGLLPARVTRISGAHAAMDGVNLLGMKDRELDTVRGSKIGMIFQEPMSSLNPAYRIGEQIAESVRRHLKLSRKDAWKRAIELLRRVGIPNPDKNADRFPHHFSGGMRQRAMIAMAIACEPQLIIADEPTTALDVTVQSMILDLLAELKEDLGVSVMLITHDLAVIAELADRVGVMYAGEMFEIGTSEQIFDDHRHPYTNGLLDSVLRLDSSGELVTIPGSIPGISEEVQGCRFAERCKFVETSCQEAPIELSDEAGHPVRCRRAHEHLWEVR